MSGFRQLDITQPITNFSEWRDALGLAKLARQDWLEVSPEIFKYLISTTSKTLTITVNDIRVFLAGTREDILDLEGMTVDVHVQYLEKVKAVEAKIASI